MDGPDIPDLVPARMLNEFTYCPRLFFLEWVNAQFADNIDTVDGRWQHRRVDEGRGAVPAADEADIKAATSVMLSSCQRPVDSARWRPTESRGGGLGFPSDRGGIDYEE